MIDISQRCYAAEWLNTLPTDLWGFLENGPPYGIDRGDDDGEDAHADAGGSRHGAAAPRVRAARRQPVVLDEDEAQGAALA